MEPFIALITMFAGNFAPRNWALCQGQLLSISQNQALFSLLGTMYGGDGRTTFALPDLRGRTALHAGQGAGLSNYPQGTKSGQETIALNQTHLPAHSHTGTLAVAVTTDAASLDDPEDSILAAGSPNSYRGVAPNAQLGGLSAAVVAAGGSQAFDSRQPYLGINYIIALQGLFPSRS